MNFTFEDLFFNFSEDTDLVLVCLSPELTIELLNPEAIRFFCCEGEKIKGENFLSFYQAHKNDEMLYESLRKFNNKKVSVSTSFNIDNENGIQYIDWAINPIRGENDKCLGIMLVGKDVTEYLLAEKRGEDADTYLENIVSNLPGFVYWKDLELRYLGCNESLAKKLGFDSQKNIVGKTQYDIEKSSNWKMGESTVESIIEMDRAIIDNNLEQSVEESGSLSDGSHIDILTKKVPLKNMKKEIIGILGISVDITDQKRAEKALAEAKRQAEIANCSKSEFLACMSHDLRTPLNGILGMAQIILKHKLEVEERDEYIRDIMRSGNHLLSIIDDILSLSKLEADRLEFIDKKFDLRQLAEEVIDELIFQAKEKNVELLTSYSECVPRYVVGDPRRLKQILMNLLGNAIKFTEQGYVLLAFEALEEDKNKATFQITVEDTGIGIDPDKLDLIFDRFSQIESSYKGRHEGVGLGLSIVRLLVGKMNGKVGVNSQLGAGSTFWCTLTLERYDQEMDVTEWQKIRDGVKLLVVDDNDKRGAIVLSQFDVTKGKIVGGLQARDEILHAAKEGDAYDVVMMNDLITPGFFKLAHLIRSFEGLQVPALLAYGKPLLHKKEIEMAPDCFFKYFASPVQPSEIIAVMTDLINHRRAELAVDTAFPDLGAEEAAPHFKVLLIEDNVINQKVQSLMLKNLGCDVVLAPDGITALELCDDSYDLVLMDIGLPDLSGFEVTSAIRENAGIRKELPIIALTAHASSEDAKRCLLSGMNDYLNKPILQNDLYQVLNEWVH